MKKLLIVTLIVLLSLSGCKKTDPIVKEWYLKVVENDGIEYDPIEFVGSDLRLDFKEDKTLVYIEPTTKYTTDGEWEVNKGVYDVSFDGLETKGKIEKGVLTLSMEEYDLYLTFVTKDVFEKYRKENPAENFIYDEGAEEELGPQAPTVLYDGTFVISNATGDFAGYDGTYTVSAKFGVANGKDYFEGVIPDLFDDPFFSTYVFINGKTITVDTSQDEEDGWFFLGPIPNEFNFVIEKNNYNLDTIKIEGDYIDPKTQAVSFHYVMELGYYSTE